MAGQNRPISFLQLLVGNNKVAPRLKNSATPFFSFFDSKTVTLEVKGAHTLSLKRVLKTLEGFGLSRIDAKMYLYLAKMGPQNASALSEALKIPKQQLYPSIKCLRDKGIIATSVGQPPLFCAVAFEKALEILIKAKVEQAKAIKETKNELLSSWRSINWQDNT